MKVFTCDDHDIVWPVGGASVVVAENQEEARKMLDNELTRKHLRPFSEKPYTLNELPVNQPVAVILADGDY